MNRAQRRAAERRGIDMPSADQPMSLKQFLSQSDQVIRRGEAWELIGLRIRLEEHRRRYNRWYNRWLRAIRRFFSKHFYLRDVEGAEDEEFPDIDHPEDVERT